VARFRVVVLAAGGLLWRDGPRGPELALVHRPRYDDWSLPKGKLERGERFRAAAVREVTEETGFTPQLGAFAGLTLYVAKRRPKLVLFWHMEADGKGAFEASHEVDRLEWLSPRDALQRLAHPGERRLVARVTARGAPGRSSGRAPSSS
jgi:8-oxo-dGTP pyrophosphatase MutT (NUDIX family)